MSRVKRTAKQKKQNNRMTLVNKIIAGIKADPKKKNAALLRLDVPSNQLHKALLKEHLLLLSEQS